HIVHALPSFAVERHSENDFFCWHSRLQKAAHRIVAVPLIKRGLGGISPIMKERAMKVCGWLSVPVQVISHDGNVVHILADFFQLKILVVLLFRRQRGSKKIAGTQLIQLAAEFHGQSSEICFVLRTSLMNAPLDRILPINIDAVKNACAFNTISEVAGNERLNARANKIAQMIWRRRAD